MNQNTKLRIKEIAQSAQNYLELTKFADKEQALTHLSAVKGYVEYLETIVKGVTE